MRADEIGARQSLWLTCGLWFFTYLTFLIPSFADDGHMAWQGYPIIAAAVSVGLALSLPLFLLMRAIREWPLWLRIFDAAIAAAGMAWIHALLDSVIVDLGRETLMGFPMPAFEIQRIIEKFGNYVFIYALYVTGIGLIMSTALAHAQERELAEAQAASNQAQLAALRFQLNPHFLFNTLNSISSLIVTKRSEAAEETVARLSEFLRASLAADPQGQVTLQDELETLAAYLDIERVRFGERLRFEVTCPPTLYGAMVPSFILQPLAENAVKYAVGPSRRGATICVEASEEKGRLRLQVEDDGEGLISQDQRVSTGVGLNNVRRRLNVLYDSRASLESGSTGAGYRVVLRLPLSFADVALRA
ncbi:Histidine kinase [Sphingomonas jatrophae]|uniref:Histidine kinase n=2 Tax=Sphingomonas jatrophae TaxID=1166337 RepID=A0A1I6JLW5_9SPHN|nr:Histidine kinase [Sphingomonas jatrophae]